jgi:hypothetical protein
MSDRVSFSDDIFFPARAATVETIFDSLSEHAPDHPEFRALVARRQSFDCMGGWFLDDLSPDAFRFLALMDEMAKDLPAAAAKGNWKAEWMPVFYVDVERFRAMLAERIAQRD